MNIIVTGAAGFIGMHVSKKLLDDGHNVTGIDNLNTYYDQTLKQNRLKSLSTYKNFIFYEQDIADKNTIMEIFLEANAECVVNLAAQAGVRYSLVDPDAYGSSNLVGFLNILEACRNYKVVIYLKFLLLGFAFSLSMVHGDGQTWLFSNLRKPFLKTSQSIFTIMVIWFEILLILTMSSTR